MALAGVTTVGEFHYLHHQPDGRPYADEHELSRQVIRAARDVGLRIALLRVGYARAGFQVEPNPRQRRFLDPDVDTFLRRTGELSALTKTDPLVTVGLAPHSVRAVPRPWLEALAAGWTQGVLHFHVSEQPAEIDACLAEHRLRPVELLAEVGLLGPRSTGVHAIHLSPVEVGLLARSRTTVCACPSTERNLGDGVVPADELLAAGVEVSLGTDSQAHVDLLEDARQLEGHLRLVRLRRNVLDPRAGHPSSLGARLLHCATSAGAHSLGVDTGTLHPGSSADFFTVDRGAPALAGLADDALLTGIMLSLPSAAIRDVAVRGKRIVSDGVHPLTEGAGRAFGAVMKRLQEV
jgi:formimidoylglutamate deiminase